MPNVSLKADSATLSLIKNPKAKVNAIRIHEWDRNHLVKMQVLGGMDHIPSKMLRQIKVNSLEMRWGADCMTQINDE